MIVTRDLLRFKWSYENGTITLIDKRKNVSFELPISYLDSLLRAGLTFKNAHKNEQLQKTHFRLQKQIESRKREVVNTKLRLGKVQERTKKLKEKYGKKR